MSELKVGDTVWISIPSNKVYERRWIPVAITGENRVSWFAKRNHLVYRFPKKADANGKLRTSPIRYGYDTGYSVLTTQKAVDDHQWVYTNKSHIAQRIEYGLVDAATLRQIAALIGYKETA